MRLTDAINKTGFTGQETSPALDLQYAGYDGYYPELAKALNGKNFDRWIQNAAYVSRNLIPVVIRTPKMFDVLADRTLGTKLKNLYIAMMTHIPLTITGLTGTVTAETTEHRIGAAGEMHEEFIKSSRERSRIVYTYVEKLGKPVNRFFDFILRYGIMDPDTQSPLLTTLPLLDNTITKGENYTPDYYTSNILYFEPDLINKNVVEAFYCVNVANKDAGEITSKRDLSSGGEIKEYTINFTSITKSGENYRRAAQAILDRMLIFNKNPDRDDVVAIHDDELAMNLASEFSFNESTVEPFAVDTATKTAFNS